MGQERKYPPTSGPHSMTSVLLRLLTRNAPPNTWLALTTINRKAKPKPTVATTCFEATEVGASQLESRAKGLDQVGKDCYVRCTLLSGKPTQGRGSKELSAGASACWVDIDDPNVDIASLRPPPTLVIKSGRGFHCYWGLSKFTDPDKVEALNKDLAAAFGGDHCYDHSHILRVPGTHNWKLPEQPREVIELPAPEGRRILYSWDTLRGAVSTHSGVTLNGIPNSPQGTLTEPQSVGPKSGALVAVEPLPGGDPTAWLDTLGDDLRSRIVEGATALEDGDSAGRSSPKADRSSNDFRVCVSLLHLGLTLGQVRFVLTNPNWGISEKSLRKVTGESYQRLTLAAAERTYKEAKAAGRKYPLQPIIREVTIGVDANGNPKRLTMWTSSDLLDRCVKSLRGREYQFLFDRSLDRCFVCGPSCGVTDLEPSNPSYLGWLYKETGMSSEEKEYRIIRDGLPLQARSIGTPCSSKAWLYAADTPKGLRLFHLDPTTNTVTKNYLDSNHTETPDVTLPNGTNGRVMLASDQMRQPLPPSPNATERPDPKLLRELFTDTLACSEVHREILTAYLLAVPLVKGFPIVTLPLLHLQGPAGGGKTQTLKLLSAFFHGFPTVNNPTVAAFYRMAPAECFIPLDDYETLTQDMRQLILNNTTGAIRRKADGSEGVASQDLHVPMAITSINELTDRPLRRRALVIHINKKKWTSRNHYKEEHWKVLAANRNALWISYLDLVRDANPTKILNNFDKLVQATEKEIFVDEFVGLAGFITLLYALWKAIGPRLGATVSSLAKWAESLDLRDDEPMLERTPLLTAVHQTFEYVMRDQTLLQNAELGDSRFALRITQREHGLLTLEGTTTEWLTTFRLTASRGGTKNYFLNSEAELGQALRALVGRDDKGSIDPRHPYVPGPEHRIGCYTFQQLKRCGRARDRRGWRIAQTNPTKEP